MPGQAPNSNDSTHFGRVAKISFDTKAGEAFISDGYGNKRVAVIDMATGKLKRYWGAYGGKPDDTRLPPYDPSAPPDKQFRNPVHCAEPTLDGLVYVCDRPNDRIQVFRRDGMLMAVTPVTQPLPGEPVFRTVVRYRTVGDMTCTAAVESFAATVDQIVEEVATSRITERGATRADDRASEAAMEDRKREGYF